MKYKSIYISGKISGDPNFEAKFRKAEQYLIAQGWNYWYIVNPAKECNQKWPWWLCMLKDLWMLRKCGFIAMLPDWPQSRGARIEHEYAIWKKKVIIYINF